MNFALHLSSLLRASLASLLIAGGAQAWAVEHPGVVPKDGQCDSCHAAKLTGASVHSATATSCTVCHVTMTQGDMTTMRLLMPKGRICFACHEESNALRQHTPAVKGPCVECHDAHSSTQKTLLRNASLATSSQSKR